MWIHFNFLCGKDKQIKLHKKLRSKILIWTKKKLINGAVLTYHFNTPRIPTNSLYVCLGIPIVRTPKNRSIIVSEETIKQIPKEIKTKMQKLVSENFNNSITDKLEILDYEFEMINNDAPSQYMGAPIEEILNFASKGTEIALELLDDIRTKNKTWSNDKSLADTIMRLINERLTTERERQIGLHFVCNPMMLNGCEQYVWRLAMAINPSFPNNPLLQRLYSIEDLSS